ncbi:hypothetical protein [Kriegella aquimaris]|uniref:O-antigen ligase like membrane protein n=1 Tax=Kriegella aquimaris TaxID=192904 RepID=A0A1G9U8H8_9FLAO|nr:hypothetical protein [Kriegella aquimaris]SDM55835.1 hypothetical protein SAMN04488514_110150 [Kriegella aquimaris]
MISYLRNRLKLDNTNDQISFASLCSICLLYAFSHPYPQVISVLELGVGLFLGIAFLMTVLHLKKSLYSLLLLAALSAIFFWPLIVGLVGGSSLGNIIRDIVPFLYLCFACLFLIRRNEGRTFFKAVHRTLPWLLTVVGILFSIREVLPFIGDILAKKGIVWLEMHLLIQSSAVTFAMCFLLLKGCNLIHLGKYFKGFGLLFLSLIPFMGTYLAVMRAPTAFYVLFILLAMFIWPVSILRKAVIGGVAFFIFIIASGPATISPYLENLTNKQKNHGNNGKVEEIVQITELTFDRPQYAQLLGQGWGSSWASPAVQTRLHPGKRISYAHSFIAYSILKFGLSGYLISLLLVILVFYLFASTWMKAKAFSYDGTVLFSSIPPLLIGIFLEPNYKTLDFSITLLILISVYKVLQSKSYETNTE